MENGLQNYVWYGKWNFDQSMYRKVVVVKGISGKRISIKLSC